jgi:hypothetical protein
MVALAVVGLGAEPGRAQSDTSRAVISGVLIDPMRNPVEGAEVRVVGSTLSAVSSAAGTFRLLVPRDKVVLLHIRRPGFRAQLLKTEGAWTGAVLLQPGVFELPEIRVTARYAKPARYSATFKYDDYFRRRRQGIGDFIDREEIDRRAPFTTADLLSGRPGIKASASAPGTGTWIYFARCNEYPPQVNVYIDGRKQIARSIAGGPSVLSAKRVPSNSIIGDLLETIAVQDIEMMEIFRGPSELPPEFNDGNCAAISIWTRQGDR